MPPFRTPHSSTACRRPRVWAPERRRGQCRCAVVRWYFAVVKQPLPSSCSNDIPKRSRSIQSGGHTWYGRCCGLRHRGRFTAGTVSSSGTSSPVPRRFAAGRVWQPQQRTEDYQDVDKSASFFFQPILHFVKSLSVNALEITRAAATRGMLTNVLLAPVAKSAAAHI